MNALQVILLIVGFVLMLASGALGHLLRGRPAPRGVSDGVRGMAVPKLSITWLDIIYAFVMILGILAKEVWDNINETQTVRVQLPRLVASLLVSPIIYAAVYSKFVSDELSLLGLAIAFQNGFFWQAVFRTAQGGAGVAAPGAVPALTATPTP